MNNANTPPPEGFIPPPSPPPFLHPDAVDHLCQQGWLRITLPHHLTSTFQQLKSLTSAFFDQSLSDKRRLYPAKQGTEFGYYHIPGEKEYLTLRCHQAQTANNDNNANNSIDPTAATLWHQTTTLLTRILHDIAQRQHHLLSQSGHLPASTTTTATTLNFTPLLAGTATMPANERAISSGTLLRLFRYYEAHSGTGAAAGVGAGAHTDLGLLTLCVGGRGLECFDWGRGEYVDVLDLPPPASLDEVVHQREGVTSSNDDDDDQESETGVVVLLGQTLRGLTGGAMNAGVHRVVGTERGRESVVFALRHGWEVEEVDLGAWGVEKEGGGGVVIKARELYKWLGIGVVSVNSDRERRERQRGVLEEMGKG